MKRPRQKRRGGATPDAEWLIRLASGLAASESRAEDRFWENQLETGLDRLFEQEDDTPLNDALDVLAADKPDAFDVLAEFVEARTEAGPADAPGGQSLLIAAPVLAWSRYRIPAGPIPAQTLANLAVQLKAHVLADGIELALADYLFSPDQLPQGYCATARFASALDEAARQHRTLTIEAEGLPETVQFLSDTRYLMGVVRAPAGAPLFRWQENGGQREEAQTQWQRQGGACLTPLLPGCAFELILPNAYFSVSRQADRLGRPHAIRASVAFLCATLNIVPADLAAVLAPFHDRELEEYRIGFSTRSNPQVLHGVVWPLLGNEDDHNEQIRHAIESVLQTCEVGEVSFIDHAFPLEYCEDCGSPLYPSSEGELVHAELPEEEGNAAPRHLH